MHSRVKSKVEDEVVDAACHKAAAETSCWKFNPGVCVKGAFDTHDEGRVGVASSFRGKAVHEIIASGGESEVSMAWSRGQF